MSLRSPIPLPLILIMFLLSRWSGGLIKRTNPRFPLIIGPLIVAGGFILFAVPEISRNYWSSFFPAVTVLGFGMAISVAPLTTTVMNSVSRNKAGVASGVNNAVSRTAGLLAVAVFGVLMLSAFNHRLNDRLQEMQMPAEAYKSLDAERSRLAEIQLPSNLEEETRITLQGAISDSFVFGFRRIMFIAAGLAIASSISAALFIKEKE